MNNNSKPHILVIAGLDPTGGAGLLADSATIMAHGCHASCVATAIVPQNTTGVSSIHPIDASIVSEQLETIASDMTIDAVKIGLLGSVEVMDVVYEFLTRLSDIPVVMDPILRSGGNDSALTTEDEIPNLLTLLPKISLLTPNGPEALALSGLETLSEAAEWLVYAGARQVFVTGGHGEGAHIHSRLFGPDGIQDFKVMRIAGEFRGTGCSMASAIAAYLAAGHPIDEAIEQAQNFVRLTLKQAFTPGQGQAIPFRFA